MEHDLYASMEQTQLPKAGPSGALPRHDDSFRWRRLAKLAWLSFAALLIFITFYQLYLYGGKQTWIWGSHGGYDDGQKHQEPAHGSLYLLGVGKADITGLLLLYSLIKTSTNIIIDPLSKSI